MSGSVRHRKDAALSKKGKDSTATGIAPRDPDVDVLNALVESTQEKTIGSEWDYKLALGIITVLAIITRFWGISHPNEVVFDEVHFGKV